MKFSRVAARSLLGALHINKGVVGIYALASVIGALISTADSIAPGQAVVQALLITLVALVMLLLGGALFARVTFTYLLTRVLAFVAVAAFAGFIRGVTLTLIEPSDTGASQLAQVLTSTYSAVVWVGLGGLFMAGRTRYRERYRSLLLQGAISSKTDIDWDEHPNVQQAKLNLAAVAGMPVDEVRDVDLLRVADAIRHEIEFNIRPLSHRLWFSSDNAEPHARWLPLVRDSLTGLTVPIGVVTLIWLVSGVVGGARLFGWQAGVLAAFISSALLYLSLKLVKWLRLHRWYWALGALSVSAVVTILGSELIVILLGYPSQVAVNPVLVVLLPLAVIALVLVAGAIALAESDRSVVLNLAERRVLAPTSRESAYLHNSLQSELTGMALQLDEAARSGSSEDARAALERVHALLARSISEEFSELHEQPMARIERVMSGWRGICSVSTQVSDQARDDPRLGAAVQATEELIANAVRHAGATWVDVAIVSTPGGLEVECRAPHGQADPKELGLGSQLLSAVSPKGVQWESDGTVTTVRLFIE